MDISNIYLKKQIVLKYLHKTRLKLVGLEINKGINDEYLWVLHESFVELHVGGADLQELEQQVSAHPRLWIRRGRDCGFIMLDLSDYVVSGMHDKFGTLGT